MIRVLGVDPGVSETGWALLDCDASGAFSLISSGLIRTSPATPFPMRLRQINESLGELMREHRPHHFAIEEMFFLKAATTVRATLQTRGVILLAASQHDTPVHEYNPKQVKITLTGSGSAPKAQMQKMVQAALKLKERLTPDDVADAAAIAICHLRLHRVKKFKILDRLGGKG